MHLRLASDVLPDRDVFRTYRDVRMEGVLQSSGQPVAFGDVLERHDRLAILKNGHLLQEAAPREAYDHPSSIDAAAALGPINTWEGFVAGGALATPFGAIATKLEPATKAKAAVRAEALALAPGSQARVIDRRPHGAHDLMRIEAQGVTWRALVSPRTPNADHVDVTIYAEGAFVFAA